MLAARCNEDLLLLASPTIIDSIIDQFYRYKGRTENKVAVRAAVVSGPQDITVTEHTYL